MSSRGVNRVTLLGNVGKEPETRYMANGTAVTNLTLATSETWKDKSSGEQKEQTEWHRVVFFRKLAEIVSQYVTKGSKIYIEGKLKTRKWQGQDGQDRYTTEIVADEMQMLDSRGGGGVAAAGGGAQDSHNTAKSNGYAPADTPSADNGGFDDDIPF